MLPCHYAEGARDAHIAPVARAGGCESHRDKRAVRVVRDAFSSRLSHLTHEHGNNTRSQHEVIPNSDRDTANATVLRGRQLRSCCTARAALAACCGRFGSGGASSRSRSAARRTNVPCPELALVKLSCAGDWRSNKRCQHFVHKDDGGSSRGLRSANSVSAANTKSLHAFDATIRRSSLCASPMVSAA